MNTVTVTISPKSKKAQYLLGLISEMAKIDHSIEIHDFESDLRQSLREVKDGDVKLIKRRTV